MSDGLNDSKQSPSDKELIEAIPLDKFKELMDNPEPCRSVLTHLFGEEATNNISDFGELRWSEAWEAIRRREIDVVMDQ